jgi:hypothetical protein
MRDETDKSTIALNSKVSTVCKIQTSMNSSICKDDLQSPLETTIIHEQDPVNLEINLQLVSHQHLPTNKDLDSAAPEIQQSSFIEHQEIIIDDSVVVKKREVKEQNQPDKLIKSFVAPTLNLRNNRHLKLNPKVHTHPRINNLLEAIKEQNRHTFSVR